MLQFVLDTNFFIQAHRGTYPLDIVTSFWSKIKELAETETIISIDKVKDEIYNNNDDLKKWCEQNLSTNFFKSTQDVMDKYGEVVNWANSKKDHYNQKAIKEFLDSKNADAFLIAYSLKNSSNTCIVTQELSAPTQKNKVKIPDCCNEFNIRFFTMIDMFRALKETF